MVKSYVYGAAGRQLKREGIDSSYGSMQRWAQDNAWPPNSSLDDRDNTVHVVSSEVVPSEHHLLIVYTTLKLLRNMVDTHRLRHGGVICADGTYCVCKTGHCVYMIGTVDVRQRYHAIGVNNKQGKQ